MSDHFSRLAETMTGGGPARQMLLGDLLLVGCCIFYLLWWVIAFKPVGGIRGMKSGWLLIPAFLLGTAAVIQIVKGTGSVSGAESFFPAGAVPIAGVVIYAVLLLVTRFAFQRQVTTELFLIVGWTVLAFLEIDALFGLGTLSRGGAAALFVIAAAVAAVSMVCYMLFYGMDAKAGYVDGMIPLILAGGFMAVLAFRIAV